MGILKSRRFFSRIAGNWNRPEQDLQIKWYSGVSGIQTAIREFIIWSKGKEYRQFENPEAFRYVGQEVADWVVKERIRTKRPNRLIVVGLKESDTWHKGHMEKSKEELRETIYISEEEYPFEADIALSDNLVLIFEYKQKPFALLIENKTLARAMIAIHQMVWERYKS